MWRREHRMPFTDSVKGDPDEYLTTDSGAIPKMKILTAIKKEKMNPIEINICK